MIKDSRYAAILKLILSDYLNSIPNFFLTHSLFSIIICIFAKNLNPMSIKIAPSLLSADFLHLEQDIDMINRSEADWFHLDVMDGVFVPNISYGFPVIDRLKEKVLKPMDAHLMIVNPEQYITRFRDARISIFSVHYEACTHLNATVMKIKEAGMQAGVALNPHTPVELLTDILDELDMVLIMSVNPGFGGQQFIPQTVNKVQRLRKMIDERGLSTLIEVDGGINFDTAKAVVAAGADVLVAGNFIFKAQDPMETIRELRTKN